MTDLHCHILPGVDDGAVDLEEALDMARIAVADGITEIVATPHTENGVYQNKGEDVRVAVDCLQAALIANRIPLKLSPGSEVHIHLHLLERVKSGKVLTINDQKRYLLLELPNHLLPQFTDELITALLMENIIPLIAHPERNAVLRKHPSRLSNWINQGVCVQINAGSVLGKWGNQTKRWAMRLIKQGWVHVLASDGHHSANRKPLLSAAYQTVGDETSERVVAFLKENAVAVQAGERCASLQPFMVNRSFFDFFRL